jgi:ribosomal-protein-alanine N-acetyltransferase
MAVVIAPGPTACPEPLTTARLLLPPLDRVTAQAVAEGRRSPSWADGYPTEGDVTLALLFLQTPDTPAPERFGHHRLVLRDGGILVGGAGFHHPPGPDGVVEIGYGLAPEYRGRGLASEAVLALIAQVAASVRAVHARVAPGNVASIRLLRRCGFSRLEPETGPGAAPEAGPDASPHPAPDDGQWTFQLLP